MLTAQITKVAIGTLEIDGLLLSDGSFAVAVPQIALLFPYFKTDKNNASILLKRLMGKDFKTDKCKAEFNKNITSLVTLIQFEKVLRKLDKLGDRVAESMSDALIGLSLEQLFNDAFGRKWEKEDRQAYLKTRLAGKVTRRSLTDAIKSYLESNLVSENYRKFIYANCSDKINLQVFGKKASQLCLERDCNPQHLRDTHTEAQLALIDRIEGHAVKLIDRGMEPQLAVSDALEFYQ